MDNQRFEPFVRNKKELKRDFVTCNYANKEERDRLFSHLADVNTSKASSSENALAFVIRSNNDDDIHKSIKYGIWTSSKENNEKLTHAFTDAQGKGLDVYLFYSVVKSGQFVGVAKMTSVYKEESFPFWWETKKWKGHFTVQWIQVKDVINKNFEHLKNMDSVEVTRSRDGAQVSWKHSGQIMMQIYEEASDAQSIFNDFAELDAREQQLRNHRSQRTEPQQFYQQQPQYQQFYQQYPQQQQYPYNQYPPNQYPQQYQNMRQIPYVSK